MNTGKEIDSSTVKELVSKAGKCEKSEDAMRFSQAALNCCHALQVLNMIKPEKQEGE